MLSKIKNWCYYNLGSYAIDLIEINHILKTERNLTFTFMVNLCDKYPKVLRGPYGKGINGNFYAEDKKLYVKLICP